MKDYNQRFNFFSKVFVVMLTILKQSKSLTGDQLLQIHPCKENNDITVLYSSNPPPEQNFQYLLFISINTGFFQKSNVQVKFDSEAFVTLNKYSNAIISSDSNSTYIDVIQRGGLGIMGLTIKGPKVGTLPHIQSIAINNVENCMDPDMEILDRHFLGIPNIEENGVNLSSSSCGRRKVLHIELIVSGQPTKPGDWPWHAAIYTVNGSLVSYICGGTLLSKTVVLTAAHCVTLRGVPRNTDSLSVTLGKYNLTGDDIGPQEREVQEIIVHEQYEYRLLNNDIAILKLKTEVVFTDYVQPACLWHDRVYKKMPDVGQFGTVVGWGFDQTKQLSSQLHQARMPKVSELTCIKSHPLFFSRLLNDQKFCAGYRNGTSVCNGDSGGGFMVFVPDVTGDESANASGAWYLRGIVSISVSRTNEAVCDPNHYVLFTDVAKLRGWTLGNMS